MLNLVSQVKDGTTDAIRAEYQWLADGTKLSAVNAAGNGYDYVGSFIYGKSGGISTLESASFSGGRIVKTSSGYEVNYFLTDHLGSTRVVLSQDMTDLQRNDFYPFGLRIDGLQFGNNRYLYNGKESQVSLGSGYLDYGARFYDPQIGSWLTIDPLAEKRPWESPYSFAGNNPIKNFDPDGRDYYLSLEKGRVEKFDGSENRFDQGYMHIGGDDATFGNISDALTAHGYDFTVDHDVAGGFVVNTELAYKGWMMMQVFSPDNVGIVLGMAMGSGSAAAEGRAAGRSAATAVARAVAKTGTQVAERGTTVLGHYPEYTNLASRLKANTFEIPINIWKTMSPVEKWAANQKFLDRMILRGDNIRLATPINQVKIGSFYQQELNYLFEKGYRVSSNGLMLIK